MTIFAGNLPQAVTEQELRTLFAAFGEVEFVNIVKQHRISAGFGFIGMPVETEAELAIASLHQSVVRGTPIVVNRTSPRRLASEW